MMTDRDRGKLFSLTTLSTLAIVFGAGAAIVAAGMLYKSSTAASIPEVRSALPIETVAAPTPADATIGSPAETLTDSTGSSAGGSTTELTPASPQTPSVPSTERCRAPTTDDGDSASSDDEDHEVVRPDVRDEDDDETTSGEDDTDDPTRYAAPETSSRAKGIIPA